MRALRALREAQHHHNATLAGQQEDRRGLGVGRKPLSDFRITHAFYRASLIAAKWPGISARFPKNSVTAKNVMRHRFGLNIMVKRENRELEAHGTDVKLVFSAGI